MANQALIREQEQVRYGLARLMLNPEFVAVGEGGLIDLAEKVLPR